MGSSWRMITVPLVLMELAPDILSALTMLWLRASSTHCSSAVLPSALVKDNSKEKYFEKLPDEKGVEICWCSALPWPKNEFPWEYEWTIYTWWLQRNMMDVDSEEGERNDECGSSFWQLPMMTCNRAGLLWMGGTSLGGRIKILAGKVEIHSSLKFSQKLGASAWCWG